MTWLKRIIAGSVAAAAIAWYLLNGVVPDSPPLAYRECYRAAIRLSCGVAKAIARNASDVPCALGSSVIIWAEVVNDSRRTEPLQLPDKVTDNIDLIEASMVPIPCANAKRPAKVITPLTWAEVGAGDKCIGGLVRKRVDDQSLGGAARWWPDANGQVGGCCGPDCVCLDPVTRLPDVSKCIVCPPYEFAGSDSCLARICEARPGLPQCGG